MTVIMHVVASANFLANILRDMSIIFITKTNRSLQRDNDDDDEESRAFPFTDI